MEAKGQPFVIFLEALSPKHIVECLRKGAKVHVASIEKMEDKVFQRRVEEALNKYLQSQGGLSSISNYQTNLSFGIHPSDQIEQSLVEKYKELNIQTNSASIFYSDLLYHNNGSGLNKRTTVEGFKAASNTDSSVVIQVINVSEGEGRGAIISQHLTALFGEKTSPGPPVQVEAYLSPDSDPLLSVVQKPNFFARNPKATSQSMFFTSGVGIASGVALATSELYPHQNWLAAAPWIALAVVSLGLFLATIKWLVSQSNVDVQQKVKGANAAEVVKAKDRATWLCEEQNILFPMAAGASGSLAIYMPHQHGLWLFLTIAVAVVALFTGICSMLSMVFQDPTQQDNYRPNISTPSWQ